ncbi:MAG TPA: ABC transporter substrate-binding protein [Gaiellaceae bacterium]|jgi:peptide/nickel transport system substrate-binding protein
MTSPGDPVEGLVAEYVEGHIDRRQFLRRAGALGLTLPAATALLARAGDALAAEEAGAGTLRIRMVNDISNLDPAFYPTLEDSNISIAVNEGLITFRPGTFDVVNQLAQKFTPSRDGLSYDFTLKKGIQFHGNYGEVTADDVKFSYERIADPREKSPYAGDWAALKEVKVKDKYSGTIILKRPFAALMRSTLPVGSGLVLSRKAVTERGKKYPTHPIGTGPYEFVSWTPKQKVVLKRFAKYGGASKAYLGSNWSEIDFIPIDDDSAADIALQSGQLDFGQLSLAGVDRFQRNSNFTVTKRVTLNFNWIGMNILHPKLKDIRVRQAIRAAVDVPSIMEAAFEGKWQRATAIIPPGMKLGYWAGAPKHPRNVDQAKALLKAANVSNLQLTFTYTEQTGADALAQIVQQNLGDVGIKLDLKKIDSGTFYTLGKNERARELFFVGYVTEPDPSWSMVWFTCPQLDVWNWMYWCDHPFDALQAKGLTTLATAKRNQIYVQMQQLWDRNCNAIWIAWPTNYYGTKKGITPAITPHAWTVAYAFKKA